VARYTLTRLLWGLLVLWVVMTLTFLATVASPVDAVEVYAGRGATEAVRDQIREEFGLDGSVIERYLNYVQALLRGDLGVSIVSGEPVGAALIDRLPATAQLALAGVVMEILIGIPLGVIAALRPGTRLDRVILLASLSGAVLPVFVVGFLLLYLLAFQAGLFPIGGYGGLKELFLPALALGLAGAPWLARMVRSTVLDVRQREFVRAARARGASERRILFRHILPNSVNPVITMLGIDAGVFFAGVLVIEKVFGWPGIGQQAWLAVSQNDIPMVMGTVVIAAAAIVLFNLLADLVNMLIDPRMRRSGRA